MIAIFDKYVLDVNPRYISILKKLKEQYLNDRSIENWRKIESLRKQIKENSIFIAEASYVD